MQLTYLSWGGGPNKSEGDTIDIEWPRERGSGAVMVATSVTSKNMATGP